MSVNDNQKPSTEWEFITPSKAEKYLTANSCNRKMRLSRVREYAEMMLSNDWNQTHQGIAFDVTGRLCDGQHRLAAICECGIGQMFLVTRGLLPDATMSFDFGAKRTEADEYSLLGYDFDRNACAIAKMMVEYQAGQNWMRTHLHRKRLLRFLIRYSGAVACANHKTRKKGISHACVRAAVATAWLTCDRQRLAEFEDVLYSGIAKSEHDTAAIRLRDYVIREPILAGGGTARLEVMNKSISALVAFLAYKPISKLYSRQPRLLAIPGWESFVKEEGIVEEE